MVTPDDDGFRALRIVGYNHPDVVPDHKPVPLVTDEAPRRTMVRVLVPNQPGYIGGTGPPMTKLFPMPPHDKTDFIIAECVQKEGKMSYIITPKDNTFLRRTVAQEDIFDFVSARTLEDFSCKEYARWELAETLKEKKLEGQRSGPYWEDENVTKSASKRKRGRPRRSRMDSPDVDEDFDEGMMLEVLPTKKVRVAPPEPDLAASEELEELEEIEGIEAPSLSQPSLSQPVSNLKRKLSSSLFSKENTPGETTDDMIEERTIRPPPKVAFNPNPTAQSPTRSFFNSLRSSPVKERSRELLLEVRQSPKARTDDKPKSRPQILPPGGSPKMLPPPQKPLFPIFAGRPKTPSAQPSPQPPSSQQSSSKLLPHERKKHPSISSSASKRKDRPHI